MTNGEKADRMCNHILELIATYHPTHNEIFAALEMARAAVQSQATWDGIQTRMDKWLEEYFSRKGSRMN